MMFVAASSAEALLAMKNRTVKIKGLAVFIARSFTTGLKIYRARMTNDFAAMINVGSIGMSEVRKCLINEGY